MPFDRDELMRGASALIRGIGEEPNRGGLLETPRRIADSLADLCSGYTKDPKEILSVDFDGDGYDEMIVLRNVDFFSLCEHHMLPFYGTASVVYIPNKRVVGLSKLARLVDCFARRLQIQERMTVEIGRALEVAISPVGWAVAVRAKHLCMMARGVAKANGEMVTTAMGGAIRNDEKARSEFLRVVGL